MVHCFNSLVLPPFSASLNEVPLPTLDSHQLIKATKLRLVLQNSKNNYYNTVMGKYFPNETVQHYGEGT